ncbi:DUF996 domain-containing protein [Thermococcus atlanticus]
MQVDIRSERNLGLIGSILALVSGVFGVIPYIGMLGRFFSLVAFILVLIALKGIGDKVGDDRPFRYYLYGFIVSIAALILIVVIALMGFALTSSRGHLTYDIMHMGAAAGFAVAGFVGVIVLIFVGTIVLAAYFQKQAWEAMYEITGVSEFHETARWLWWGALTLIVLVGVILLFIAAIYQIIAFSNLPEVLETGEETGGEVILY